MERLFSPDGPVMTFLTKTGQLIILTVLWLACCIPIVTVAASSSALYYAVIKSVRREVGYPTKEFFAAFKRNLERGALISLVLLIIPVLLYVNFSYLNTTQDPVHLFMYFGNLAVCFFAVAFAIYVFPVMSRFDMGPGGWMKTALKLMIMRLPYTVILTVGLALILWVLFFYISVAFVFLVPGAYTFGATFLMEPALKKLMPPAAEGEEEQWYDK